MRTGSRRDPRRAGFTLLEVLLTSLLASVVLVALWSLSDIYLKMFAAGRKKIEESQLVRGITQQLEHDLLQVLQIPEGESSPFEHSGSDVTAATRSGLTVPTQRGLGLGAQPGVPRTDFPTRNPPPVNPPANPVNATTAGHHETPAPKFGLIGSRHSLRLHVLQSHPGANSFQAQLAAAMPQPGEARPAQVPELRAIQYTFELPYDSTSTSTQHPPGLTRREWDWETWSSMRLARQQFSGASESAEAAPEDEEEVPVEEADKKAELNTLHVPQVVDLEFRYFDGEVWETEWDSWERQSLPLLVEVTLEIDISVEQHRADAANRAASLAEAAESSDGASSEGSSFDDETYGNVHRQVIHLPMARRPAEPVMSPNALPVAERGSSSPSVGMRQP